MASAATASGSGSAARGATSGLAAASVGRGAAARGAEAGAGGAPLRLRLEQLFDLALEFFIFFLQASYILSNLARCFEHGTNLI